MNFTENNNDTTKLMIPAFASTFQFKQKHPCIAIRREKENSLSYKLTEPSSSS